MCKIRTPSLREGKRPTQGHTAGKAAADRSVRRPLLPAFSFPPSALPEGTGPLLPGNGVSDGLRERLRERPTRAAGEEGFLEEALPTLSFKNKSLPAKGPGIPERREGAGERQWPRGFPSHPGFCPQAEMRGQ